MHEIICNHCGRGHRLSDEKLAQFAGKTAQCVCGHTITIEAPAPQLAPAPVGPSEDEMFDAILSTPPAPAEPAEAPGIPPSDYVDLSARPAPVSGDHSGASRRSVALGYRPRTRSQPGTLRDFLEFRRMITVSIVTWVFLLGSIGLVLAALFTVYQAVTSNARVETQVETMATAVFGAVVGVVVLRLLCEFAVVVFRINETLTEIKNQRSE